MANKNGEHRGEYVCVDENPETIRSSRDNDQGRSVNCLRMSSMCVVP